MRNHIARPLLLTCAALLFGYAPLARADANATINLDAGFFRSHGTVHVAYVPFAPQDFINPLTNQPFTGDELVKIKDLPTQVSVAVQKLNEMERFLNGLGKSLHVGGNLGTLEELIVGAEGMLDRQKQRTLLAHHGFDIPNLSPEGLENYLKDQIQKRGGSDLLKLYELAQQNPPVLNMPSLPSLPSEFVAPKFELKVDKSKTWAYDLGDKGTIGAHGEATLRIQGEESKATLDINAALLGYFFNWRAPLAEVKGTLVAPASGDFDGNLDFYLFSAKMPGTTRHDSTPGSNSGTIARYPLPKIEQSVHFTIGPVPCSVTFGARGQAYWNWGVGLSPLKASAGIYPGVESDAYVEMGVDIIIAGAGAGGELTLLNDALKVEGNAELSLDENASPQFSLGVSGTNSLSALAGRLYGYVKVGLFGLNAEYDIDFFKWDGIQLPESTIFNYRKYITSAGTRAEGDLDAADVAELTREANEAQLRQAEAQLGSEENQAFVWLVNDLRGANQLEALTASARIEQAQATLRAGFEQYLSLASTP